MLKVATTVSSPALMKDGLTCSAMAPVGGMGVLRIVGLMIIPSRRMVFFPIVLRAIMPMRTGAFIIPSATAVIKLVCGEL